MPQEPNASSAYEKRPLAPEVVKCKAQCPSRVALESDFHFVHLGPLFADRARRTPAAISRCTVTDATQAPAALGNGIEAHTRSPTACPPTLSAALRQWPGQCVALLSPSLASVRERALAVRTFLLVVFG